MINEIKSTENHASRTYTEVVDELIAVSAFRQSGGYAFEDAARERRTLLGEAGDTAKALGGIGVQSAKLEVTDPETSASL